MVFRTFQQLTVASSLQALQGAEYALKIPDIRSLTPAEGYLAALGTGELHPIGDGGPGCSHQCHCRIALDTNSSTDFGQSSQRGALSAPSGVRVCVSIF